jgi:hypothetical protein
MERYQGTSALSAKGDLLLQEFVNFFKTIDTLDGLFNHGGFISFFS